MTTSLRKDHNSLGTAVRIAQSGSPQLYSLCALLIGGAVVSATGCSNSPNGGMNPMPMYDYKPATIHQIDTDSGSGPFGDGQRVVLDRVVAVSKVDKYVNSVNQQCRYQIWVQDAACTTPPCGLVLKAVGPQAPSPSSTGKDCPSKTDSGTLLAQIGRGDNARIRGKIVLEPDNVQPYTVLEHQLFVESIEILPQEQIITPTVFENTAMYNQFQRHLGMTWNKYEGMLVTLRPNAGTLQVLSLDGKGFQTSPGPVDWGDTFDGDYYPAGATTFPAIGAMYRAISGVVSTRHGGGILPGRNSDFVP